MTKEQRKQLLREAAAREKAELKAKRDAERQAKLDTIAARRLAKTRAKLDAQRAKDSLRNAGWRPNGPKRRRGGVPSWDCPNRSTARNSIRSTGIRRERTRWRRTACAGILWLRIRCRSTRWG